MKHIDSLATLQEEWDQMLCTIQFLQELILITVHLLELV
nr:MAG TPA: Pre-mRNA-splicing factor 8, Pre-mRNA-splicing factor-mRNA splicing, spliceosome, post-catalytic, P [Caudoviricetes sp.]